MNAGEGADLIYASEGGQVIIEGGVFKACYKQPGTDGINENFMALNLKNNGADGSNIIVRGGKFYGFDPGNNEAEIPKPHSFLDEGYESIMTGTF